MDDLLFKIIYIAVTIIAAIVVRYLVPYINSKTDDTKFLELKSFIKKAIAWAEDAITGEGKGSDKFNLVLEKAIEWINDKGIKITEEQVRIIIQGIFAEVDGATVNIKKVEVKTSEEVSE